MAHETGGADTVDPLAGSYYVERLTNDLARQARAIMDEVAAMGGAVAAIESGWMQDRIAEASWRHQRRVDDGDEVVVGVNDYREGGEQPQTIFSVDRRLVDEQLARLARHRRERDAEAATAALAALKAACAGDANLMPPILDAVRAYATLGEICGTMREVFGEYRPPTVI